MATVVSLSDLSDALEFVSGNAATFGNRAYVCRNTGRVFLASKEFGDDPDLPIDIESSDQYVPVPDARSLDLGEPMVRRFVREFFAHDADELIALFRGKGAYARFKDYLLRKDRLDEWHAFRDAQTRATLIDWCASQGWTVDESDPRMGSSVGRSHV